MRGMPSAMSRESAKAAARPSLSFSAGTWQRTLPANDDVLLSCVVSPGFVYAGFQLAGKSPEA